MSLTLAPPVHEPTRRLHHRDRVSVRLAELDTIRAVLLRAAGRVQVGWVQDAWASYAGEPGARVLDGVCLVSAVRVSGASPPSQQVDRALDVAWHTLHHDSDGIRWTPPPSIRLARVRDLTRWNDHTARTGADVVDLLLASSEAAAHEMARLRVS